MANDKPAPRLWLPQYWPAWLTIGFFRLLAPLPWELLLRLGRGLGRTLFYLVPIRRAVTLRNLELCFPELSAKERRELARRCYESFGMGFMEALISYFSEKERFAGRFTIEGLEHLEAARAAKRGVLLLSAHFHTIEVSGYVANMHFPLSAFYRNPNHPVFAHELLRLRAHRLKRMFPADDLKGAVRALREGDMLWYAPDQGKRIKDSVLAPFFGVPAVSNAATGKIARLGRALVIPWGAVRERRDGRWHYRVTIGAPLPELPEDPVAEATAINAAVERFVRAAPEQYLWQHKRFKRRGEGYPDVYAGMR
jgi:Kdo2-lipid IVA lauroyltransferase/acyltransferase